jgi:hypothetical protein
VRTIIVDVEWPNGDVGCTVRANVNGDDIRFLSLKGGTICYPEPGEKVDHEKVVFVHVAPWDSRAANSIDLPYITGVSQAPPLWPDLPTRHYLRMREAVIPVRPITPND